MDEDVHKQLIDNYKKQNLQFKQLVLSTKGRIGRMHYNIFFVPFILLTTLFKEKVFQSTVSGILVVIAIAWIAVVMQAKRWHDRNKSAWWVLVNFVPIVGQLWAIVSCCFLRGTEGNNKYGQPNN
jgi:uncharacterized membrane protein YhaH (DUF805 family)